MIHETLEAVAVPEKKKAIPCVSIILPFEPKMTPLSELAQQLKSTAEKVRVMLLSDYKQTGGPVMKKLQSVLHDLNFNTHKKTIAIFVSPLIAKVFYLDIDVEEKIIIDDSFELRDLIYRKKRSHEYLLVNLAATSTKIYLGSPGRLVQLIANFAENLPGYRNDDASGQSQTGHVDREEDTLLDKFLKHTDMGLTLLLHAYHLPLFVTGTQSTLDHFQSITHNGIHVVGYIHGNFEKLGEEAISKTMAPYVANWKKVVQDDLLNQVAEARGRHKLSVGMHQVWKSASQHRGKLLITSKNFRYSGGPDSVNEDIIKYHEKVRNVFYIKDAVDDVIEKVLAAGGDVEFVDAELMDDYEDIVLIEAAAQY